MRLLLLLLLGLSPLLSPAADPPRFQEGDYQLDVIRISGKEPGLTALVFGGIHGDEPGGYFSSELLAHIRLRRGNLIIVPRVNFPSIMLGRREVAGDMNRKFAGQVGAADPERRVVEALKRLMGEADLFVNLHDAMGFHRRKYQSKTRNPDMYGQCLIVDTGKFQSRRLSREIDLEAVGARIVAAGNALIPDAGHHFEFWNHNSIQKDTQFPEMKKSATHFALTEFSIPAFGLEASKDLPTLDLKVHYQLVMIQAILTEFGFEFDLPEIDLVPSRLSWVEFRKNDGERLRLSGQSNLRARIGDRLTVVGVQAHPDAGVSADLLGFGSLNDIGREWRVSRAANLVLKRNSVIIGRIYIRPFRPDSIQRIELAIADRPRTVSNWAVVEMPTAGEARWLGLAPVAGKITLARHDPAGDTAQVPAGAWKVGLEDFPERERTMEFRIYADGKLAGGIWFDRP